MEKYSGFPREDLFEPSDRGNIEGKIIRILGEIDKDFTDQTERGPQPKPSEFADRVFKHYFDAIEGVRENLSCNICPAGALEYLSEREKEILYSKVVSEIERFGMRKYIGGRKCDRRGRPKF